MNDSLVKNLLNYSTGLTKTARKKLESTKSKDERIDVISKQIEDLRKKVHEVINKDNSDAERDKSDSGIKLEFNKLHKRIDVLEANELVQLNFLTGLMKSKDEDEGGDKDDPDDSLFGKLKDLFGDDKGLLSVGLDAMGAVGKGLLGLVTNPYVLISIASIAALYGIGKIIEKDKEEVKAREENVNTIISGTTKEAIEEAFNDASGGKSINEMMKEAAEANSPEKRQEIIDKLNTILEVVQEKTAESMNENMPDQSKVPEKAANLAVDPQADKANIKHDKKYILTGWDRFKLNLYGEDEELYHESMIPQDLSALGSIYGYGGNLSGSEVAKRIQYDYSKLQYSESYNVKDYESYNSQFMNDPNFKKFNYSDPLKSIRDISIEYTKIMCAYSEVKVTEGIFTNYHTKWFRAFTDIIGRDEGYMSSMMRSTSGRQGNDGSENPWDTLKDQIGSISGDTTKFKNSYPESKNRFLKLYARKVYKLIPRFDKELKNIYYSIVYSDQNKYYASLMTIAQQYDILGASRYLDENNSKVLGIGKRFYFLPYTIKVNGADYTLDRNTRVTLNSVGINLAYKLDTGNHYSYSDQMMITQDSILSDSIMFQTIQAAASDASLNVDVRSMITNLGSYNTDTIIYGITSEYSGIDKENKEQMNAFMTELQNASYEDLLYASKNKDSELYTKLLTYIPNNDESNLDTVLGQVTKYIKEDSSHSDDIIESYNKATGANLTREDFNKILAKIASSEELRNEYMEARNETDNKVKATKYSIIAQKLGLKYSDIGTMVQRGTIIPLLDRIFNNYRIRLLTDEGEDDLDAIVYTYMGVSGFSTEDPSASINLFGLGTADELSQMGFSNQDIATFLKYAKANEKLSSQAVAQSDGSLELMYNIAGNSNDSEVVKNAVIEAFKELGISEDMAELLRSNGTISEAQYALLTSSGSVSNESGSMTDTVVDNMN